MDRTVNWPQIVPYLASGASILVGFVVLLGWAFDLPALKSVVPGLVTMKANTALAFILLGFSLWLSRSGPRGRPDLPGRRVAQGLAIVVGAIAGLTLLEYATGWDLGIDQLLVTEAASAAGTSSPGRMAIGTALSFFMLAASLVTLGTDVRGRVWIAQSFALIAFLFGLLNVIQYAYGVTPTLGSFGGTLMAVHTALVFMVVSGGVLSLRPREGPMAILTTEATGGVMARRLLPASAALLVVFGWLHLEGERTSLFSTGLGSSLLILVSIIAFGATILWSAQSMNRIDSVRRKAERAMRESEERLKSIIDNMSAVIYMKDLEGRYILVNRQFEKLFRTTLDRTRGKTDHDLFPSEMADTFQESDRKALVSEVPLEVEEIIPHEDGPRVYASSKFALHGLEGRPVSVCGVRTDITERKNAEKQIARQAKELARSNGDLEQFAYVASHDLQEPLRMVASYTQLLAKRYKGKLDKEADEFIGFAVDGANRMQRLINDLLAYSRIGTRGRELQPTDVNVVLDKVLMDLRPAVEESDAEIARDPMPTVMADEAQLVQVFQNLLGNAIKFRGAMRPRVHVGAETNGHDWIFSVSDNGIGIDRKYFDRLFVMFQRLHGRDEYPGTGIGLAVCKRIVEKHEGRIWVESEPGQGSTFYFTIPERGSG